MQPDTTSANKVGIDVAALERELTALWKHAGEEEEQGGIIRACVLNLLVYVPTPEAQEAVDEVLAEVTASHPSRAVLIVSNRESANSSMGAWVTSRCTLPTPHSKQVCCEQITVVAEGSQVNEVPSAVVPLLLSDLPVYLWWRATPPLGDKVFRKLAGLADRVIINSGDFTDPHEGLVRLSRFLRDNPRWTGLSDLNWGRLNTWRNLIAGFYDVAAYRPYLEDVGRIDLTYTPPAGRPDLIAPRALLLIGWMASRLGWRPGGEGLRREGEAWVYRFTDGGRNRQITFLPAPERTGAPAHVLEFTLRATADGSASFRIRKTTEGRHLETEVTLNGERRMRRVLSYEHWRESILVGQELEILGHDRVYEQAILAIEELLAGPDQSQPPAVPTPSVKDGSAAEGR